MAHHKTIHGLYGTKIYRTWRGMIQRCERVNCKDFSEYGARGISVHPRWRSSVEAFLADMGPPPSPKSTIERIENEGNYEPGNCRWAGYKEQNRNRRSTRLIEFLDEKRPLIEWCEIFCLNKNTAWRRLNAGWPPVMAFTLPPIGNRKKAVNFSQFPP